MGALAPTIVLIVGLGFFPQPLLDVINPAVDPVVERIGVGDPPPEVGVTPPSDDDHEGGH